MVGLFQGHDDLIQQFFYLLQILNQPRDSYFVNPSYRPPQPYDVYYYPNYYPIFDTFPSISPVDPSFYPSAVQLPVSVPSPQQLQAPSQSQSQLHSQPSSQLPSQLPSQSASQLQSGMVGSFVVPSSSTSRPSAAAAQESLRGAASDALPFAERRFFEQVRRDISSDEIYQQFLKLLSLYSRGILPLSELFSALTDLLHIRHPVVSHLRNYLAQKGIREDEVGAARTRCLVDEPPLAAAVLGADPRLQGAHAVLPRAAAADPAPRGVAAVVRGQPGAERQPGVADDGVGGPVVHRGAAGRR